MKIDWIKKLSSRKFWAAITGFVTTLLVAFKVDNLRIEQTVSIISAAAVLIAYIIGEGLVDASRILTEQKNQDENRGAEEKAKTSETNL